MFASLHAKHVGVENLHGKGKPIITAEVNDWRFVAVGDELHYSQASKTEFFPDFLGNYASALLGREWGKAEIAKPLNERHQILKWYDSMCQYQKTLKPDANGHYVCEGTGASLSWLRLAYDLYLIKHNVRLAEKDT